MEWDLGLGGVGLLLAMGFAAAVVAQVFTWRSMTHRLWLAATAAYAAIGLFVSEVLFGWATAEDLQPNVDGLSTDEVLLAMVLSVAGTVLLARWRATHRPDCAARPAAAHVAIHRSRPEQVASGAVRSRR